MEITIALTKTTKQMKQIVVSVIFNWNYNEM